MMRALASLLVLLATGCGSLAAEDPPAEPPAAPRSANVVLYVSNQSFARPTVDIRVEVDGRVIADDDFAVESQHNWVEFRLNLRPGRHVLRASSDEGGAVLERTFLVRGKRWAVVDYWCCDDASDPRFTFQVSRKRIAFA